jgi:hypothetical protein
MRGRPRKEQEQPRVGLYIMPDTRRRLNIWKALVGAGNQDEAIAIALDRAGAPEVSAVAEAVPAVRS